MKRVRLFLSSFLDDNYIFSSERMGFLYEDIYINKSPSLFKSILRLGLNFIRSIKYFSLEVFFIEKNKGLALIGSNNNYETIKPFEKELDINIISFLGKYNKSKVFPNFLLYLASIFTFPITIFMFLLANKYQKKSFEYCLNEYLIIPSLRAFYFILFYFKKPKYIIIVNDHICYYRSAVKIAKLLKIKTYYIQHAAVTEKFPPLFTDVCFLDGEDSLNKYNPSNDFKGEIILSGSSKYDDFFKIKSDKEKIDKIGVATNEYDDFEIVKTVLTELSKYYKIILRSHPLDKRYDKWNLLEKMNENIELSLSKEESTIQFLKKVDFIIAYNSSILLESLLSRRKACSYQFSKRDFDHYGFTKNDLIHHFNRTDLLIDFIKNKVSKEGINQEACKYYYHLFGTKDEGNSTKVILSYIMKHN